MAATEFTITVWADVPADRSHASVLAQGVCKAIFDATGRRAEVAGFDVKVVEPSEIEAFVAAAPGTSRRAKRGGRKRSQS